MHGIAGMKGPRDTERRRGLDHGEKRWGIYLKWHRLDPRRPPKDLFPRRAALSEEKRGSRAVLPFPSFLSLLFIYIYVFPLLFSFSSSLYTGHSRGKGHFRWWSSEWRINGLMINWLEDFFFFSFFLRNNLSIGKYLWNIYYVFLFTVLFLYLRLFD